jgi:hypothetical protein
VKAGHRHRYYVSKGHGTRTRKGAAPGRASEAYGDWRLPVREIEALVQDAVLALLADRADLARRMREAGVEARQLPDFLSSVDGWVGARWELVQRVELRPEEVTVQLDLSRFLDGEALEIRFAVPARIERRGVETRFVVEGRTLGRSPTKRFAVFERDGWRCSVPGCTSHRNLHAHHVPFRSAGGGDDPANLTTLCAAHHLRGVHGGILRISGRAPDGLLFELPLGSYRSGD